MPEKYEKYDYKKVSENQVSKKLKVLTIDEFLQQIGQLGRFQIVVIVISSFLFVIPSCQSLLLVFIAYSPPWKCTNSNNTCSGFTVHYEGQPGFNDRCKMERSDWTYDIPKSYSIVSEFDLVCSRESLSYLANSALFIGQIFGGLANGWLADRYGRKKVLFSCSTVMALLAFASSFSPNIYVMIVLRILTGYCVSGVIISAIIITVELVGAKYRALAGLIMWNMWTVSTCFMSLQSYYVHEWRTLSIILSIPYIIFNAGMLIVPESIRWNHSKGRIEDTIALLKRVSRWNGKIFPVDSTLEPYQKPEARVESQSDSFFKWIWFSKKNAIKTFIFAFLWLSNDCIYYSISLAFSDLGGSRHRDFVLITFPEIFANLLSIYIIERIGRRRSTLIGYVVTASGLITFGVLHILHYRHLAASLSVGMIGKISILLSYCGVEIWSIESFPTNIRSRATGLFYVLSQLGASCSPWIAKGLIRYHPTLPFFVMAALPVLGFAFSLIIKETKGQDIDAVDEGNDNAYADEATLMNKEESEC